MNIHEIKTRVEIREKIEIREIRKFDSQSNLSIFHSIDQMIDHLIEEENDDSEEIILSLLSMRENLINQEIHQFSIDR